MRWAFAIAIVAVALAAAVYVHERRIAYAIPKGPCDYFNTTCAETTGYSHPSWEDPAAVLLALGSLAVAAGIVTVRRGPK